MTTPPPPPPRDGGEQGGEYICEYGRVGCTDPKHAPMTPEGVAVRRERDAAVAELVEAARDALDALTVIDRTVYFYRGRLPKRARETLTDALTCGAWGDLRKALAAFDRDGG